MKLPIIEALKTVQKERVARPNRFTDISYKIDSKFNLGSEHVRMVTSATFEMDQVVSELQLAQSRNGEIFNHFHERAARAIAREVYGPVVDRLRHIQYSCWERGDEEAANDIGSLIEDIEV